MHPQVPSAEQARSRRRYTWRLVAGVPLVIFAVGLAADACMGLPVSRGETPWLARLGGLLGLGVLYLMAEAVGGWTASWDKVTDPLSKRVFHLVVMLGVWSSVVVAAWLITSSR